MIFRNVSQEADQVPNQLSAPPENSAKKPVEEEEEEESDTDFVIDMRRILYKVIADGDENGFDRGWEVCFAYHEYICEQF
jgi:hypothetical protein